MDKNENGKIFVSDYMAIMEECEIKIDDEEIEKIAAMADDKGEIKRNEFIIYMKNSDHWKQDLASKFRPGARSTKVEISANRQDKAEAAFKLLDKNRDGYITKDEFANVSKNLTPKQVEAVFGKFDKNGDGRLSFGEFKQLIEGKAQKSDKE